MVVKVGVFSKALQFLLREDKPIFALVLIFFVNFERRETKVVFDV